MRILSGTTAFTIYNMYWVLVVYTLNESRRCACMHACVHRSWPGIEMRKRVARHTKSLPTAFTRAYLLGVISFRCRAAFCAPTKLAKGASCYSTASSCLLYGPPGKRESLYYDYYDDDDDDDVYRHVLLCTRLFIWIFHYTDISTYTYRYFISFTCILYIYTYK